MTKQVKTQKKKTVSAVTKIQTLSKTRFVSTVKHSETASEVLRRLGIYQNGRNVEAVTNRAIKEKVSFTSSI